MRYLLILTLLLSGCAAKYYAPGSSGYIEYYYNDMSGRSICYMCKKNTYLHKSENGKKVVCDDCYSKKIKKY